MDWNNIEKCVQKTAIVHVSAIVIFAVAGTGLHAGNSGYRNKKYTMNQH
jgi:hypothetical protein